MDFHLAGKVVIFIGGAAGIGSAISFGLAAEGAIPVVVDRNLLSAEFEAPLREHSPEVLAVQVDLQDEGACAEAVAATLRAFGRIDGLVNNAGLNDGLGFGAGPTAFRASLERNLVHGYAMAHHGLPALKSSRGAIVNIASKTALTGQGDPVLHRVTEDRFGRLSAPKRPFRFPPCLAVRSVPAGVDPMTS